MQKRGYPLKFMFAAYDDRLQIDDLKVKNVIELDTLIEYRNR